MKINNWCRKLASALVAGGLLLPSFAYAAGLNTNLVINGDFENVDVNVTGAYGSPKILDWTGINLYAYSHDASVTPANGGGPGQSPFVPDYAETVPPTNVDPPGAGHWYFTSNNTGLTDPTDVHEPGLYYQDISVNSGGTSLAIAAGSATYNLSAYMTSYKDDTDVGHIRAEFRDGIGSVLGVAGQIDDSDPGAANVWNLNSATGPVPVGTATVRLSLWATRTAGGGGADGYFDNVDFRIQGIPEPSSIALGAVGAAAAGFGFRRRRNQS